MKRLLLILLSLAMASGLVPLVMWQAHAAGYANPMVASAVSAAAAQQGTPTQIIPEPYTVAPNQPVPEPHSTVGIINALCDVNINFISCSFLPASISIVCDTNADGVPELMIPLKDVTIINPLVVRATLPALGPQLPGTPFPLACCGGKANVVMSLTVTEGDNNIFGTFTLTQTVEIDLGQRAPVIISASPSTADCAVPQNLIIPGSCFLLADGKPNVTSVFAVDRNNPTNVIQSKNFVIINTNVIDALFDFGAANAGKTFLIYAMGPNGTSRNLTALPQGTPTPCPLGNEQGVQVTVTCRQATGGGVIVDPAFPPIINGCRLERSPSGIFSLLISGVSLRPAATLTIGGVSPKKAKFKELEEGSVTFYRLISAKGRICGPLPGNIVITDPTLGASAPFFCAQRCLE